MGARKATLATKPAASGSMLRRYWQDSRDPLTATLAVLPLFVFYQVGLLGAGGLQNGADFVTRHLMSLMGGMGGYLLLQAVVLIGFIAAAWVLRKQGRFHGKLLPWMMLESTLYALLFGSAVILLMRMVGLSALLGIGLSGLDVTSGVVAKAPEHDLIQKLVMSAGAGLYEELVFRVILMGGLFAALHKGLKQSKMVAAIVAVLASSIIFSAVHHLGSLGEPFTMSAFSYRVFAGILFAALFRWRGFAIAAYTHAFYDVYVMVFRHG
jgi:membrane protease YdiL (CAAX protease family)